MKNLEGGGGGEGVLILHCCAFLGTCTHRWENIEMDITDIAYKGVNS
jgi:hypothetical protein